MKKWCAAATVMAASCAYYRPSFTRRATGQRSLSRSSSLSRPAVPWISWGAYSPPNSLPSLANNSSLKTRPALPARSARPPSHPHRRTAHTFGLVFDTHAVNPSTIAKMPFDTLKDLASVMLVSTAAMAIVAHEKQPYKDFRDLLAAAKKKPKAVAYGSVGTGSLVTLR